MVRLNRESDIEFYVGTDVNGNKIPIPFENILITGMCGTGKTMFIENLLQDALLRYTEKKVQFRIWSRIPEYELWDVSKVTDGMRKIPNLRIVDTSNIHYEKLPESVCDFLCEAAKVCTTRYEHLRDYGAKNIWMYNRCGDDMDKDMVPLVYILDEPFDQLTDEAKTAFNNIIKLGRVTGVILIWAIQGACRVSITGFTESFQNKFVFNTDKDNSECVLGSSYCANVSNRGVGRGMCIYQRFNLPYIPLDIPKFSYSLGRKIARALSQEV